MADHRLRKEDRCRTTQEFDRVFHTNVYAADSVLVVMVAENQSDRVRLGMSVSRKVGNAVVRNRWKRWIRESFRQQRHRLPKGIDIVVRPRKGARPGFEPIFRSLPSLVRRATERLRRSKR